MRSPALEEEEDDDELGRRQELVKALLLADVDDNNGMMMGGEEDILLSRQQRPLDLCQELLERIDKESSYSTKPGGGGDGSTTTTVRSALGNNITSNQVSELSRVLSLLMSEDRVDRSELMPGTYDEEANLEAASDNQMAMTLTRTSLLAAQLYALLLTKPGAFASGLVEDQALSALSALLKRWRMECCGREAQALQREEDEGSSSNKNRSSGKRSSSSKNKKRFSGEERRSNRQPLKRSRGSSQQSDDSCSSSSDEDDDESTCSDNDDDLLVVGKDDDEQQSNALTPRDLVKLGLEVAKHISTVPLNKEVWNWSRDSRDTVIDIVACVLGTSSALIAPSSNSSTTTNNKMVDKSLVTIGNEVITLASRSLSQCCCISLDGSNLTKRLDTTNSILKGLMPLITMKQNLPKGQSGNSNAAANASRILADLIRNVSRDVTSNTRSKQQGESASLLRTPAKTPSRNNENNMTPMSTGRRTARASLGGGTSTSPLLSPPKLKTPTTSNRSVMVKKHRQQVSDNQSKHKMHPLFRILVAMLMTMVSQKDLEKASTRTSVSETWIGCLPNLPSPERLRLIKFLINLSTSKVASHRQTSTELIGQVLVQEWFWKEHCYESLTTAACSSLLHDQDLRPRSSLGTSPTVPETFSNATRDGEEREDDSEHCLPGVLLATLEGRMVDRLPAIRVSSANALANLFRQLLEAPSQATAQRMQSAISNQASLLLNRLHSRSISDDKATVRKASLGAFIELLLIVEQSPIVRSINDNDLVVLERLCCDTSILTRKASAEALTRLLEWYSSPRNDVQNKDTNNTSNSSFNGRILVRSGNSSSSSNMLQEIENAWTRAVLPLALDSETSCANKAVELFDRVVLDPLLLQNHHNSGSNNNKDDSDSNESSSTTSAGCCETPWRILANVTSGGDNNNRSSSSLGVVNHSNGQVNALRAMLKHKAITNDTASSSLLGQILKIIHQTCVGTLAGDNDDLFEPNVQAQRSGVWVLFDTLVSLKNKVPSKIIQILKRKKLRLNFLIECWEKLLDLFTASTTTSLSNESLERLLASMKHCLTVISNLAPTGFDGEIGTTFSNDLECLLSNFLLPVEIIGAAVRALVAVSCSSAIALAASDNNSEHYVRIACTTKIRSLLTACEDEIATHIGTFEKGVTAEAAAAESKLVRAIHTTGELCLVGFSESDDSSSGSTGATDATTGTGTSDQPLRGFYERPSTRLVDLVQFFLPHTLPSGDGNVKSPDIIRAHAFLTLGKMCLRDEKLASRSLNILARELHESMGGDDGRSTATASNALLILGDLCVRYTNLVDRFLPVMACCIQSGINAAGDGGGVVIALDDPSESYRKKQSAMIRIHSIRLLSSLLIQDYIKWRGLLFHRFLVATCDEDEEVACVAKMVLNGPLLAKQPKLFANHFVESLFVLNRCTAHPIYESAAALGDGGSGIAVGFDGIELSGEVGRARRHLMYEFMLSKMTDEEKISVTARIAKEVLGNALDEGSALNRVCSGVKDATASTTETTEAAENTAAADDEGAYNVLRDAFSVLSSKSIRISRGGGSGSADRDEEDVAVSTNTNEAGSQRQRVVVAKGRLLSKLSRKHLLEIIIPILRNLYAQLQSKCSPLQKDLMRYLVYVYNMNKVEVEELLSNDQNILEEIKYEARKEKQKKRSSNSSAAAD